MRASDLVIAENGCSASEGGGRFVRIMTCVPGFVCIACTDYDKNLHGNVYPVGRNGALVDDQGVPHLARELVPGVELLRCVSFTTACTDEFVFALQAAYNLLACGGDGSGPNEGQRRLLADIYSLLEPPLDERFRMVHQWLPSKEDCERSAPFGPRGRWAQAPSP